MVQLSQSEETAERIYNLLRNGKISERQLTLNVQWLNEKKLGNTIFDIFTFKIK